MAIRKEEGGMRIRTRDGQKGWGVMENSEKQKAIDRHFVFPKKAGGTTKRKDSRAARNPELGRSSTRPV